MEVIKQSKNSFNAPGKVSMKTLKEEKLRVVAYARVSTDHDDQKHSYDSQQIYYSKKISKNPNWTFVGIYSDEAISGRQAKNRPGFMSMMKDAVDDKFDLILTKSVSRFARNTLDTLHYVRILRDKKIAVYFEEENVNTLDMNGELLLTILSAIAQQEAVNLSEHVKLGIKIRAQQGKIVGGTSCYGYIYNKEKKTLEINPVTSEVVKRIFKLYLEGNGTAKIARYLTEDEIPTAMGNKQWEEGVITKILRNEKYKGDLWNCKFYSPNPMARKSVRNKGERESYYIKNHHEAIIDEETWENVQKEMNRRASKFGEIVKRDFNVRYPFSGKFICGFCGKSFSRDNAVSLRNPKYYCRGTLKARMGTCTESKMIDEEILKKIFMQMAIKLRRKIKIDDKFPIPVKHYLKHARKILLNRDDLKENKIDGQLVKDIIKYGVIGERKENGKADPFVVRFILKTEEDIVLRITSKKSKNLYKIIEFDSHNILYYFAPDKKGKLRQVFVENIKVTCEVDLGDREWK